jgi:hypothetical protein
VRKDRAAKTRYDAAAMTEEVSRDQLKRAVEAQHGCTATLLQSVPVKEAFEGKAVWDGVVHVFRIDGHPRANKAYAWSPRLRAAISGGSLRCCTSRRLRRQ